MTGGKNRPQGDFLMRNLYGTVVGRSLVVAAACAVVLVSARASEPLTASTSPASQDPAKVEVKTEVVKEVEVKKAEVQEKAAVKIEGKIAGKVQVIQKVQAVPAEKAVVVEIDEEDEEAMGQPANLARQFTQQYQIFLEVELRLLTSAAEPTPAQRREIAIEGGKALKQAALKMAQFQNGIQQRGRAANVMPDARKVASDAVALAAKERLSPEQFDRYKLEITARSKVQREAEVLHLVALLDRLLLLSKDQRDKLQETLQSHWDETNFPSLDTANIYEGYYPMINNIYLNPILDADQRKIWNAATKISYAAVRNFNINNNNGMALQPGESTDPDVKAAFAEEPKK
jgi:hypothetical protein